MMNNLLAQQAVVNSNPIEGLGPLGAPGANAPTLFNNFLSGTIGLLTVIAGIWFTFVFITGAIALIGSEGDKGALETAKKKVSTGLIGLIVVVASIFVVDILGGLIGLDSILDPGSFVGTLF